MVSLATLVELVLDAVFSQASVPVFVGVVAACLLALAIRAYADRKRIAWEEVYNSKVGFHRPFDTNNPASAEAVLNNFNNVSVVVLRIWNVGRVAIVDEDYLNRLSFTCEPDRYIVDFRLSEAQPPTLSTDATASWHVSRTGAEPSHPTLSQADLRAALPESLSPRRTGGTGGGVTDEDREQRRQLTMVRLALAPKDSFKLVICLREDKDRTSDEPRTSKGYTVAGRIRSGTVVDRGATVRRSYKPTWMGATATVAVLAVLALTIIWLRPMPPAYCAAGPGAGPVTIVGSTAFDAQVRYAADRYRAECGGPALTVVTTGSIDGVRRLAEAREPTIAFADGVQSTARGLDATPIAVLTYAVVANPSAGVDGLTLEQLRAVYAGSVSNWSELGGANLPIVLVGRGADSGSRQAFEQHVLGGPEGPVTSNNCRELDRGFPARTVRCELPDNAQALQAVGDIPGAIGYAAIADLGSTRATALTIDGRQAIPSLLTAGYPFWTIEYAYGRGGVATNQTTRAFVDYLRTDQIARRLAEENLVPCQRSDGFTEPLCLAGR